MTSIVKKYFVTEVINKPRGWGNAGAMLLCAATNVSRSALARGLSPRLRIVLVALKRLVVPRVIPTICLSVIALSYVAGQGTANAAQPFAKLNERAIDEYVVPNFEKLESATVKLATTLGKACDRPTGQLSAIQDDFKKTVLAWAGVEFLRLGPMGAEARAERFDFSPDPRRVVERQMRRLLARRDAAVLDPQVLAKKSVAVQGLPALQVLLTSRRHSILADTEDGRYRCRFAVSIAKNLENIAREAVSGWTGANGWGAKMLNPGPDNLQYRSSAEAAAALVRALITGLQLIQNRQIMPMIAAQSKPGKKPRLPFARSGLSADYIAASVISCKRYYETLGLSVYIPESESWMKQWIVDAFDRVAREGPVAVQSFADGQEHPERERKLRFLRFQVEGIRKLIGRKIASVANLTIGFNELDGD